MAVIAIPTAIAFYFLSEAQKAKPELEYATVLSFGSRPFEDGPRPLMNVRLADGSEQTVFIGRAAVRSCRRDDKVLLERRGLSLRVAPQACKGPDAQT